MLESTPVRRVASLAATVLALFGLILALLVACAEESDHGPWGGGNGPGGSGSGGNPPRGAVDGGTGTGDDGGAGDDDDGGPGDGERDSGPGFTIDAGV
jgi:hypothetical protein